MKTTLKILFFITSPIWVIPVVLIALIFIAYEDFSEFVDKILGDKNA